MDNARFVLIVFLVLLSMMLYQQWQIDYGPKPPATAGESGLPAAKPPTAEAGSDVPAAAGGVPAEARAIPESHQRIAVATDVVRLEIDTKGGDIRLLDLLDYPASKDAPEQPVRLLTDEEPIFVAQSGFVGDKTQAPTHLSQWRAEATEYKLANGQNELRIPLTWTNDQGITVTKTYILKRGSYDIGLEHQVSNRGSAPWSAQQYVQLQRRDPGDKNKDQFVRTYTGAVYHTPDAPYEKIEFKDIAKEKGKEWATAVDGWVAMIQHYFLAAWIPPAGQQYDFYTQTVSGPNYVIGAKSPEHVVEPGASATIETRFYGGPKLVRTLEKTAPGLDLTVDYGALTIFAKPIFWMLEQFHKIFNNWGWAIIFVTITLKALFFRLSAASYRSMAKMRQLQPKLQELKERYGTNKQELNMKMMEMYKKEKVNPLGGCLPILVQIPVFIALYWVLIETVEMRQAPFMGWIQDLSAKDPYFILPAIMGVSMFIQQKLSPPPSDPVQAKIMQFFPIMFTGFFAFFPSGLVLYWVVNNLLSILQQWYINKTIGAQVPAKAAT
jgi:YidC/Oxa1 family membrane protein insertase